MDKNLVILVVLFSSCWYDGCNSVDIDVADRFEQMEKKLSVYGTLQQEVVSLRKYVTRLENRVLDLETEREGTKNNSLAIVFISTRDIRPVPMVAFTAYVDHNVYHLGLDQPIPYNNIITNVGNGFSQYTHVFTCPITGIYMFTFTVCADDFPQFIAKLVIDNQTIVAAVSELTSKYREIQGSNTAVVQVSKGQSVWVHFIGTSDNTIRSDDNYRFAAFSGFLIQTI